jgi:hypothetical protein
VGQAFEPASNWKGLSCGSTSPSTGSRHRSASANIPEGNLPSVQTFQVEGAQALAEAAVVLDVLALKAEKSFSTFWPPHLGHSTSEVEAPKRTNFSNFSPHSRHRYS